GLTAEAERERRAGIGMLDDICGKMVARTFAAVAMGQPVGAYKGICPFMGLAPFTNEEQGFFFGREEWVARLLKQWEADNFLAVLGPSGSGKSSLVLAGVVPRVATPAQTAYMTPGRQPLVALGRHAAVLRQRGAVLVVDQFEELFTLAVAEQREPFVTALLRLAVQVRVVVTMRADFWGECSQYGALRDKMLAQQVLISPMTEGELRQAMLAQASLAGLRFDPDLAEQLLADVAGEPGAMPLLQHVLKALWLRRYGPWLRREAYHEIGQVQKGIAHTADEIYESLSEREQAQMQDIFIRLTRLDEDGVGVEGERRDTRRRVAFTELVPAEGDEAETRALVEKLAAPAARLVVTSKNLATGVDEVEVAHEALIRHWPRLRKWLDDDLDMWYWREQIREAAQLWAEEADEGGKEDLLVHRGTRLASIEVFVERGKLRLSELERGYVAACIALREAEKRAEAAQRRQEIETAQQMAAAAEKAKRAAERGAAADKRAAAEAEKRVLVEQESNVKIKRRSRQLWIAVGVLALLVVATMWLTVEAREARDEAQFQARQSQAREYAANANSWRLRAPIDSLLWAWGASRIADVDNSKLPVIYDALNDSVDIWQKGDFGGLNIRFYAFHPQNGSMLASDDLGARLWNKDGEPIKFLVPNSINGSFNHDGSRMAVAQEGGLIWLGDGEGDEVKVVPGDNSWFAGDGRYLVTTFDANQSGAQVWTQDGQFIAELRGENLYFMGDGEQALTQQPNELLLWRMGDGSVVKRIPGRLALEGDALWNGKVLGNDILVIDDESGLVSIWDNQGELVSSLDVAGAKSAAISASGQSVLVARAGGVSLRGRNGEVMAELEGVRAIFAGQTERLLLYDGEVAHLWDADSGYLASLGKPHIKAISFDQASEQLFVYDYNTGFSSVWHIDGHRLGTMGGDAYPLTLGVFSPDGKYVAGYNWFGVGNGGNNRVEIWEIGIGQVNNYAWETAVGSVSWSPRGDLLAVQSSLGDSPNRAQLITLHGTVERIEPILSFRGVSGDGRFIAWRDLYMGRFIVWQDGEPIKDSLRYTSGRASFSHDGQFVAIAGGGEGDMIVMSLVDEEVFEWPYHGDFVRFSPVRNEIFVEDGVDGNNRYYLLDMDGNELFAYQFVDERGMDLSLSEAQFSADGEQFLIYSWRSNEIQVWARENELIHRFEMDMLQSAAYGAALRGDGAYVAVLGFEDSDGYLLTAEGELVATLVGADAALSDIAFVPSGKHVVGLSRQGGVYLWDLTGQLLATWTVPVSVKTSRPQLNIVDEDGAVLFMVSGEAEAMYSSFVQKINYYGDYEALKRMSETLWPKLTTIDKCVDIVVNRDWCMVDDAEMGEVSER
ncbi:MAG TPA: WD40 repeat domain-containing protein, partial [Anaerolineae bacterium]|nr:WD40 repeat domain-containing protein [Anaerolineae bacterium]